VWPWPLFANNCKVTSHIPVLSDIVFAFPYLDNTRNHWLGISPEAPYHKRRSRNAVLLGIPSHPGYGDSFPGILLMKYIPTWHIAAKITASNLNFQDIRANWWLTKSRSSDVCLTIIVKNSESSGTSKSGDHGLMMLYRVNHIHICLLYHLDLHSSRSRVQREVPESSSSAMPEREYRVWKYISLLYQQVGWADYQIYGRKKNSTGITQTLRNRTQN